MSTLEIRAVRPEDHDAWKPLWLGYLSFYETELPDLVSETTWQRLLDANEPMNAALAWQDGRAVGLVQWIYHRSNWSIEPSCYLQDLFVDPQQRAQGVGRQLIAHVNESARAYGACKVHWLTHETNATAIALYEKVAERPGFIQFRQVL